MEMIALDEKEFYLEVKGNHMDYDTLKEYTNYLLTFNLKKQHIVYDIIVFIVVMLFGFKYKMINIYTVMICPFTIVLLDLIEYLIVPYSTKMKKPINFIKEVHGVDEMNYNLLFNDYSFKVETDGISKEFEYSKIKRVIRINGGIFIWLSGLYFVFVIFQKWIQRAKKLY